MRRLTSILAMAVALVAGSIGSTGAVDLALVLLNDVSKSIDELEYGLMKDGYRAAFSDADVVASITNNGAGVAVAYAEFSGLGEVELVKGFDLLVDEESARAFGEAIALAPRTGAGNTSLAGGLLAAAELLKNSSYRDARLVIDVASDYHGDEGRTARVRDKIVADGITINALALLDDRIIGTFDGRQTYTVTKTGTLSIGEFYSRDVIGGEGNFMVEAKDIGVFGDALKRKLLLEFIASRDGVLPPLGRDEQNAVLAGGTVRVN